MAQDDPRHLLIKIAKILKQLRIPYLVTGGMAVLIWGRPRFTADIDIVVELKIDDIDKLEPILMKLSQGSYIDKFAMQEAWRNSGEFNFIDGQTGIKVDFWVMKRTFFNLDRLKRRVAKRILGQKVHFSSPEDLILSKLDWYQQSESIRHLEDIESILKISQKKLDMRYLKTQAFKLGFLRILNKLIKSK